MSQANGNAAGRRIDLLAGEGGRTAGDGARPWLGVYFRCAHMYVRVLRNAAGTGYQARCPKCGKTIRFAVGASGSERRTFEVSC